MPQAQVFIDHLTFRFVIWRRAGASTARRWRRSESRRSSSRAGSAGDRRAGSTSLSGRASRPHRCISPSPRRTGRQSIPSTRRRWAPEARTMALPGLGPATTRTTTPDTSSTSTGTTSRPSAMKGSSHEVSSHFHRHPEHEHPRRAGRPAGQADCRVQRPLYSHRRAALPRRTCTRLPVRHRPPVRIGLEVVGSAGAHGAAQHQEGILDACCSGG